MKAERLEPPLSGAKTEPRRQTQEHSSQYHWNPEVVLKEQPSPGAP
jgi:hypothetical protein